MQSRKTSLGVSLRIVSSVSISPNIVCLYTPLHSRYIIPSISCTMTNTKWFQHTAKQVKIPPLPGNHFLHRIWSIVFLLGLKWTWLRTAVPQALVFPNFAVSHDSKVILDDRQLVRSDPFFSTGILCISSVFLLSNMSLLMPYLFYCSPK